MSPSNGVPHKRICIIGAGPSGLTAIKQCRDEALDVVCFERTDGLGGLWRYKDASDDGIASVAKSTIINTSKEYSGFSDFPPPEKFPNYMHNTVMVSLVSTRSNMEMHPCNLIVLTFQFRYFEMYAEHFKLAQFIRNKTRVIDVTFNDDYDLTGRWRVRVEKDDGEQYSEVFDGVMVCTGHHVTPLIPTFPGQEKFKGKQRTQSPQLLLRIINNVVGAGKITHTHSYKTSAGYEDKTVVVVGVGNSGADAAVELSSVSKLVYLATRRGVWIRGRVGARGRPLDRTTATRVFSWLTSSLPASWTNYLLELNANWGVDHVLYGLKPNHRFMQQHPTINDALPNCILSGRVNVKRNIREFTENGVIFEGSNEEVPVDIVLLATGYQLTLPFIDSSIISVNKNDVRLFKNVFQAELQHPHTLALIGLVQPLGPIHTTAELQSRWFAALMAGHLKLPPKTEMKRVIAEDRRLRDSLFYGTPRHSLEVHYIPYTETIAEYLGVKPNLLKYALLDPQLFYHLVFGMYATYQFRLEGRHKWPGARDAILNIDKRIDATLQTVDGITADRK